MTDALTLRAAALLSHQRLRTQVALLLLTAGLGVAFVLAVGIGPVQIGPGEILSMLLERAGLGGPTEPNPLHEAVLIGIRLPRACLAVLTGAALACAGAVLQGMFRNPLADPGLIGVSTGAALMAALLIVLGGALAPDAPSQLRDLALPVAAFGGGLVTTFLVYHIAVQDGRVDVATMLLAGIALNAIAGAAIGLLIFLSDDQALRDLNFWLLGSLTGVTWDRLLYAAPLMLVPTLFLITLARPLNGLLLGEVEALHLGFDVERVKRRAVLLAALAVGASVALTGIIGFVGLVVPHVIRLALGPDHRLLIPASILLGAIFLLTTDLLARTLVLPAELPIGILTSCVGGPFFLWLLQRRQGMGLW